MKKCFCFHVRELTEKEKFAPHGNVSILCCTLYEMKPLSFRTAPSSCRSSLPWGHAMQIVRSMLSLLLLLVAVTAAAQTTATGVDRLYILDCGNSRAPDQSRWSPGVNVGKSIELSDNCYLLRHASGYFVWDTGYPDSIGDKPVTTPVGTASRNRTLASQLAEIDVKPSDVRFVGISHTHGDHIGNVDLFPAATVLIQKAEYEWAFAADKKPPFDAKHAVRKLEGDLDVFGDGSTMIISTPGHTPGHQSL